MGGGGDRAPTDLLAPLSVRRVAVSGGEDVEVLGSERRTHFVHTMWGWALTFCVIRRGVAA